MTTMATSVNEHTGKIVKTGTDNYEAFSKNFDLIGNSEYIDKTVTMFPVTIKIPQQLHRDLQELADLSEQTVAETLQKIVLENLG